MHGLSGWESIGNDGCECVVGVWYVWCWQVCKRSDWSHGMQCLWRGQVQSSDDWCSSMLGLSGWGSIGNDGCECIVDVWCVWCWQVCKRIDWSHGMHRL